MELIKKSLRAVMLFTLGFALVYILRNWIDMLRFGTEYPWWFYPAYALLRFGPTLALLGSGYGLIALVEKFKER